MFDLIQVTIFISATLALLVIPGPKVLYIVAGSPEQERTAGFISALGVGLASIVHVIFAGKPGDWRNEKSAAGGHPSTHRVKGFVLC